MEVYVAEGAGFCFGVKRAVDGACREAERGPVAAYGSLIHNKAVVGDLEKRGVRVVDSLDTVAPGETLVIRSHGVPPDIYNEIDAHGIHFVDLTCPYVKRIHGLVSKAAAAGKGIIILGDPGHPEVEGTRGWAGGGEVIRSVEEARNKILPEREYILVAQTTFSVEAFGRIAEILAAKVSSLQIEDTLCSATRDNQARASELSRRVTRMFVIGDRSSSNTMKLYEICRENLKETYLVESINEIMLNNFSYGDKIGITAGASTPPAIIKEALKFMSEFETDNIQNEDQPAGQGIEQAAEQADVQLNDQPVEQEDDEAVVQKDQTFEEMLSESFVTLHTGDIVKGTVIQVTNGEILVNLGYKSDGVIQKGQYSDDPEVDPAEVFKPGDPIEVYVLRVNDGDGNVLLSKKRLDSQKNLVEVDDALQNHTTLKGKITEVIKGGVIANICGLRAFVPSSQVSDRYVEDLEALKGMEYDFNILEFDKSRRRIVAGRRELALKEAETLKEKVFTEIQPGMRVTGTVSRLTDFGAFVDLGGVDGLIHISELSWGRVRKVSDVLSRGDSVVVNVLDVNKDKGKISLSLKDVGNDPWNDVDGRYDIGSVITGKVVRMVSFGAFVELEEGVDGLVHISQIADKHVVKPEDELQIGQIISVKVTDVDVDNRRISLSKKAADEVLDQDDDGYDDDYDDDYDEPDVQDEPNLEEESEPGAQDEPAEVSETEAEQPAAEEAPEAEAESETPAEATGDAE